MIRLSYDGQEIGRTEVPLSQLGVTFGLDPKLFTDKKEPSKLWLDPTTSAIIELGPVD